MNLPSTLRHSKTHRERLRQRRLRRAFARLTGNTDIDRAILEARMRAARPGSITLVDRLP